MDEQKIRKPRPYWHVDAKWIVGLIFVLVLTLTFVTYNLVQVTAEEPAIDFLTSILATMFSRGDAGLDEQFDIDSLTEQMANSPDGSWQPIPGLRITVKAEDIAGLSPRETRLWFFRQWAEPLYYGGAEGLADLADDPEMRASIEEGVGPIGMINSNTHNQLQQALSILGLSCLGLLLLIVLFSYRFGRLGSPGCVIFVAALPGIALLPLTSSLTSRAPAASSEGLTAMLANVAAEALPDVLAIAQRNYLIALGTGFGLMLLAALGSLIWRPKR